MDREQRIRQIAYEIWVAEGYPANQEERHWRMAEQIFAQEEAEAFKPSEAGKEEDASTGGSTPPVGKGEKNRTKEGA